MIKNINKEKQKKIEYYPIVYLIWIFIDLDFELTQVILFMDS